MNKQTNIPTLRFPEFKGEWETKKLGEISDFISKGTTPSKFVNEGIRFIKIECFDGDKINANKCLFIDEQTHNKELKRSILQENDLLFAIAGATIGKVNFVSKEILPANTNQALAIVRLKNSEIKNYIYQILKSNRMQKYITDSISVGAQPNLNLEQMNNFSFYYPTLPEQKRIASFFTVLDKKIAQLKTKKQLLQQYKKGVMQQLFTPSELGLEGLEDDRMEEEKNPTILKSKKSKFRQEDGKDFPKWEMKKLGDIVKIQSGNSPSFYELNEINKNPFIKVEELNNCNKYQFESRNYTNSKKGLLKENCVIFPKRGAAILNNKVRINKVPLIMDSNLMALECYENIFFEFLYYFIDFEKLYKIADTSSIPQINNKHIEPYFIKLPCLVEQTKIANFLSSIDEKINHTETQIQQTQGWKKGLLQKMFV